MANTTVNIDIQVQSKTLAQLESELEQINAELKEVPIGSDAFKNLSKDAQKVTGELEKVNKEIEGFTFDEKITAADGAIKVMGGSVAGLVGALGVLGVESEVFGEFEKKAASAIAVAVGLKDISEGVKQLAPAFKFAGDGAKLFGITTRKALIATGIGAFVVALGTVIAYWSDIVDYFDQSGASAEELNKQLENNLSVSEGTVGVLEAQKALLEGQGKSTYEVNQQLLAELEIQIEITKQMIAQKQLQLDKEKANNKEISFWEGLKIGTAQYFGLYGRMSKEISDATNENSEETYTMQNELFGLQTKLSQLELKKLGITKEATTQAEMLKVAQTPLEPLETIEARGVKLAEVGQIQAKTLDEVALKTINAQHALAQKIAADEEALALEEGRTAALGASGQALQALGGILNQESAAAKALAVSSAIINTYLGVSEVLKQKSTLPSPFDVITKVANVATILATGFKAVQGIKSTPASGGGSISQASMTPLAGPSGVSMRDIQPSIQQQAPQPFLLYPTLRAYVVSGDVTTAQEADAKLNNKRTLAG